MPLAKDVATDLRKLADSLDKNPEQNVPKPYVYFSAHEKSEFMAAARVLPRPFRKYIDNQGTSYAMLCVKYDGDSVYVWAAVPQTLICTLVEPAKPAVYRCEPVLSAEEDAALEVE